jgi:hypothetical protein
MTRAPKPRPGQARNVPHGAGPGSKGPAHLKAPDLPWPSLPNSLDNVVIRQLSGSSKLAVDRFAAPNKVDELRVELIGVYREAAHARKTSTATKAQLMRGKRALAQLTGAQKTLAKVAPDGQVGLLRALQGSPLDDKTGEREINEFASDCESIRMDVALAAQALHLAIERAEQAQRSPGERPKRLRTLVDALADWCQSRGRPLAPTVKANRRDGAPAVVHGRHGVFLELALALFSEVDKFKKSEVEAAVTNVHEKRSRRRD